MNIKITFDFHDIFVDSRNAWLEAFYELTQNKNIISDYCNKISKKEICKKYNLNYKEVELLYRKKLTKINKNIEFAKKLSEFYKIDIISLSRKDRLIKDIEKFNLKNIFDKIYSKEEIINKEKFFKSISSQYDFIIYFNHEHEEIIKADNIIYIPINFEGDLAQFDNISFTEHAKDKLLYNELSKYYMQAIVNDTKEETKFIDNIYKENISITPGKILDCCCGVGRHDYILGNNGYKVTGIDISKEQINNARCIHNHKNVRYEVMDVRNINLVDKYYDMAICMWTTYNYLSLDSDFLSFVKSTYNHLKKNGILILDSKNIPKLEKRRVYKRNSYIKDKMNMELIINKFVNKNIQNSQYFYFIKEGEEKNFFFDQEFVRFYTLEEIKKIVKDYYKVIKVYGNFDESQYDKNNSNRFIVILKKI